MDYAGLYQKKLTSAEEAVKVVKSGDWVDYGWCTNHPYTLDKALAARQSELKDIKVRGGVTMWMPEICKAEDAGEHFTWHSWHCSGIDRKIIAKGMGYFSPMRYSELPRFYRDGNVHVDVAMIQVTPMDKHGNFSYALASSHLADMLDTAKTVIVEVNENLPWVYGLTGCEISFNATPAGGFAPFVHAHKLNEEVYIIVSGGGTFMVDGEEFSVKEGDVVRVDPAGKRACKAGDEGMTYICIQAQAGSLTQATMDDGVMCDSKASWME